jgi:transcriptional regulator with XRE-family HTH domain
VINIRDEKYIKEFGLNLKQIRLSKGFSQEELANSSDVSLAQITRIERGVINPTLCTIKSLAIGLGLKTNTLFDFEK